MSKKFKYRNQEYVTTKAKDTESYRFICEICEKENAKYLGGSPTKCIATKRDGTTRFNCAKICKGLDVYPKRIK